MRTVRTRLIPTVAASMTSIVLLSACGGGSDTDGKTSASSEADAKSVEDIEVTWGKDDSTPKVTVPDDGVVKVKETASRTIEEGDGKKLSSDAIVELDLALYSGKTGKLLKNTSTYGESPLVLDLGNAQALPGLVKAIKGQQVGNQGLAAVPPKDLFGKQGMPEMGISGKDSVVMAYSVRGEVPSTAAGEKVTPKDGLPTVDWKKDAPAKITVPKDAKEPSKLVVQQLIKGDGKTVKKGDTVYVTYTGATFKDGKVFDSSMQKGRGPFAFPVGQKSVIPGWDKAVEGAKVGDRLLLVVPAKDGYGKEGTPDGSIPPNSTLVFVVDILAAN